MIKLLLNLLLIIKMLWLFAEVKDSRLFKGFPDDLMKDLASQPLTENSHKWSLAVTVCLSLPLYQEKKVLMINITHTRSAVQDQQSTSCTGCEIWAFSTLSMTQLVSRNNLTGQIIIKQIIYRAPSYTSFSFCSFQTYNTNEKLKKFYKVLSTNTDGKTEFVSTMEGGYITLPQCDFITPSLQQDKTEENCSHKLFSFLLPLCSL